MPKISDYQTTESPKDDDVLLVQTVEHGTRKVTYDKLTDVILKGDYSYE